MNRLIQKQLERLRVAKVDSFDELKNTFTFKRHSEREFKLNNVYIIKLSNQLINPQNNELLMSNWNSGKHPTHNYIKMQVQKKLGNMIFVCGAYYDIHTQDVMSEYWNGWLPEEQLEIIEEVK